MSTRLNRLFDIGRLLRFAAVGVLNTALGYTVILTGLWLGYGDILSNLLGYATGLVLGFVLNSRWTFSNTSRICAGTVLRYVLSFVFAYGANLLIVLAALSFGMKGNPWVHLLGIVVYSVLFYLASAHVVFRTDRKQTPEKT
ncbi:GtrA family protein [Rhizobium sp. 32-5/1]|uniref:GtrA family protein n=1 Tax=Rhizobium sp. 32-5/1 TaxID=3019602 RepID=UPI00240E45BE|nr:GtrA family protein [Rhizobium sp. 32-5/1]WEZ83054.1 GtrA family protein [Rhizobium sp. 32-5/1]